MLVMLGSSFLHPGQEPFHGSIADSSHWISSGSGYRWELGPALSLNVMIASPTHTHSDSGVRQTTSAVPERARLVTLSKGSSSTGWCVSRRNITCEHVAFVAVSKPMNEHDETQRTEVDIHTTQAAVLSSLNHRKQLASLMAGGFAGTFASTITCPLEVIKTKLQSISSVESGGKHATFLSVARNIARQEGVRGFFRGLLPTWVGILPARATYFWAYSTTKSVLAHVFGESDARTHVASAAMAGVVSNALTNPIWMVKTRMQLDTGGFNGFHYRGYGDACRRILAEEGIAGFYKGLTASFWGVSEGAIHFLVYERLKKFLQQRQRAKLDEGVDQHEADKLPAVQYLLAAGFSKLVASTLTYPHEVVRTRLREQRPVYPGGPLKYRSVPHALWVIGREEGRRGLYCGMGTHLLRVVPNTALMFLAYELVSRWIEKYYAQRDEERTQKAARISTS